MKLCIKQLYPYLALILAPLLWSGNFAIGRIFHQQIPPFQFAFYRWLIVIVMLFPFVKKSFRIHKPYILNQWKELILLSVLSVSIYTSFVYVGLSDTTVINAALINASIPILIILLSILILKDKFTLLKLLGVISSGMGVIITMQGNINSLTSLHFNSGDFFIAIAALSWAVFSVLYKKFSLSLPPLTFLFFTAIIGEFILLIPFLSEIYRGYMMQINIATITSIFYAAIFSSLFAFTFWNIGVRNIGPSQAGYYINLLPIYSFIWAYLFLGEKFHAYQIIGALFIFMGIYIATIVKLKISKKLDQNKLVTINN